jgi:hypothetical protein
MQFAYHEIIRACLSRVCCLRVGEREARSRTRARRRRAHAVGLTAALRLLRRIHGICEVALVVFRVGWCGGYVGVGVIPWLVGKVGELLIGHARDVPLPPVPTRFWTWGRRVPESRGPGPSHLKESPPNLPCTDLPGPGPTEVANPAHPAG